MSGADSPAGARALRIGRGVVLGLCAVLLVLFLIGLVLWRPGFYMVLEVLLVSVTVVAAYFILRGALSWFRLYLVLVLVLFATAGGEVPLVVRDLYPQFAGFADTLQGLAWIALFPLAYVFPDGRFVPRWTRWAAAGWALWLAVVAATGSEGESPVETAALLTLFASCVVAQIYRYARVSGPIERLQLRWVMYAVGLRFAVSLLLSVTPLRSLQDDPVVHAVSMLVSYLVAAALPAAIAVAIVRHRLFDIDVVISRTFVWVLLTGFVLGTYAVVVGGVGALWRGGGVALPIVATTLVAVAFSPVREQVQRRVNRLVYGESHDPYGVLSRLGRQLAGIVRPETVAPAIVEAVTRALKMPQVAISPSPGPESFPLAYRGESLGWLVVGGRTLSPGDRRLLTDLASQCGAALYAAQESERTRRLAEDLQRTREQLVTTREEERRHIRRDLHDSLGPALSGQALTLDTARALLASDPAAADNLLRDLKTQSQETLEEVRRLARRLRPPVLDDLGLAAALDDLREQYRRQGLPMDVRIPALPDLPAAVEVAVYRIAGEALTNVVRHAGATTCCLSIELTGGALVLEITDNGRGIPPGVRAGVGTASMRERAEELGGTLHMAGTRVTARIPLKED